MNLVLHERWLRRIEILRNAKAYVRRIKEICMGEIDPDCRVILLRSVARGTYRIDSDIDVLIITSKATDAWSRAEIASVIHEKLRVYDPLELHVITISEFENWYKRFIDVYEEV
ncbi:nucleotidyltransferase domain-containing protein [Caldivirga sp. UBA161]|uniref:nucleotidyltransferase domain-containing protein n=1 Tax=Caldivirga sp. UBA161 TaxID=1915569 RepID=UPI0025C06BE5|nr:nucleotidyltransferase domain-containing protein [Caldivirga sp. UBA161]